MCEQCPFVMRQLEKSITVELCSKIKTNPTIGYNSILKDCPYNTPDKEIMSISEYVQERNSHVN